MSQSKDPSTVSEHASATVEDLKALLSEAEQALGSAGNASSDEIQALRERLRDVLADGKSTLQQFSESARRQAARADEVVRANPYQTIGAAAAVGLIAGFLISRGCGGSRT